MKIMDEILVHALASMIKIAKFVKTWNIANAWSLVDDIAVTCDEILNKTESEVINPSNEIRYWLIVTALLSIAYLLLLVAIVVKYCMKCKMTIPCLLLDMD